MKTLGIYENIKRKNGILITYNIESWFCVPWFAGSLLAFRAAHFSCAYHGDKCAAASEAFKKGKPELTRP